MAASSENLAAMSGVDAFLLRQSLLADFWPAPADTKALQHSLYYNFDADADDDFNLLLPPPPDHNQQHQNQQQQTFSPFSDLDQQQQQLQQQQPISTPSASDPETATTPKRRVAAAAAKGRIVKRKSRATKKNLTTFIAADPANFRQMVQQVTGVRFDAAAAASSTSSSSPLPPLSQLLLKPEPRRPVGSLYSACLPTLDTSSLLLGHRDNHQSTQPLTADGSIYSSGGLAAAPSYGGGDGGAAYGAADGMATYPTLESWKAM